MTKQLTIRMPNFRSKLHCWWAIWVIGWKAHYGVEKSPFTAITRFSKEHKQLTINSFKHLMKPHVEGINLQGN